VHPIGEINLFASCWFKICIKEERIRRSQPEGFKETLDLTFEKSKGSLDQQREHSKKPT